jgi:hypothetical protein
VRGEPEGPFRVNGPFEAAAAPRVQRVLVKIEHTGAVIIDQAPGLNKCFPFVTLHTGLSYELAQTIDGEEAASSYD